MPRRKLTTRQKAITTRNATRAAKLAKAMEPREKELYGQLLEAHMLADHSLGLNTRFINDHNTLVYKRVVDPEASGVQASHALPHMARVSAYTYMLGMRALLCIHEQALIKNGMDPIRAKGKIDVLKTKLDDIEHAYHRHASTITSGPSAELYRQSFIRDHLAPFITKYKLHIPRRTTSIKAAIKALDKAKDYPGIMMTPYIMRTYGLVKTANGTVLTHYMREEIPFTHTSDAIKAEYRDCEDKEWFKAQGDLEKSLIRAYKPQLEAGNHGTPSQTRRSLIDIKNGSTTRVYLMDPQRIRDANRGASPVLISETHHTAANSLANARVPQAERQRITGLMLENLREQLGTETLTNITLLSEHGDDMLRLKDEMDGKIPGTYLDQHIVRDTRDAAYKLQGIESGNVCLNAFRYGESDDVKTIKDYLGHIGSKVTELFDVPMTVQKTYRSNTTTLAIDIHDDLDAIKKQIKTIRNTIKASRARVANADQVIAKGLGIPPLVRAIVRSKLAKEGVRQSVIDNLSNEQLNRLAATKVNSKNIRRSLRESVDGEVKGIELLQQYQQLILSINTLTDAIKNNLQNLSDTDPVVMEYRRLLNEIKPPGLVTNCASGQNRTLIVDQVSAAISMTQALPLKRPKDETIKLHRKELPGYVMKAMTDDYHVQIRSGLGFTNPNYFLRNKSNDATSRTREPDGAVASRKFALCADWKAVDQTLVPLREWVESYRGIEIPTFFKDALINILRNLRKHAVDQRAEIDTKALPPHLQKLYKSMEEECSVDGPLRGTSLKQHPMWPSLLIARRAHAIQMNCEAIAKKAWNELTEQKKESLTPPPIMTQAVAARDKAMESLLSKLHFRLRESLSKEKRDSIKACLDVVEKANNIYQGSRFHEKYKLYKNMKEPLKAIYQAWASISSPQDAKKHLMPLAKGLRIKANDFIVALPKPKKAPPKKKPPVRKKPPKKKKPAAKKKSVKRKTAQRAAVPSPSPATSKPPTPKHTGTRASSDELMEILSAIAAEFYGKQWRPEAVPPLKESPETPVKSKYVGYDQVFKHQEKPISRFFNTPAHIPASTPENSLVLHGVSPETPAYNSKHVISMTLPTPKRQPKTACAKHLELGLQQNKIRYVNVPKGNVAQEHIQKLLVLFEKSGHKSITLTGYFSETVKKGLAQACEQKGIRFFDRTDPIAHLPTTQLGA